VRPAAEAPVLSAETEAALASSLGAMDLHEILDLIENPFDESVSINGRAFKLTDVRAYLQTRFESRLADEVRKAGTAADPAARDAELARLKKVLAVLLPSFGLFRTMDWAVFERLKKVFDEAVEANPFLAGDMRARRDIVSYAYSVLDGSQESWHYANRNGADILAQNLVWLREAGIDFTAFRNSVPAAIRDRVDWDLVAAGDLSRLETELRKLSNADFYEFADKYSQWLDTAPGLREKARRVVTQKKEELLREVNGRPENITDSVRKRASGVVALAVSARDKEENRAAQIKILEEEIALLQASVDQMEKTGEPKRGERERVTKLIRSLTEDRDNLRSNKAKPQGGFFYNVTNLLTGRFVSEGGIAELGTGQGKTITSIIPQFIHSLAGRTTFQILTTDKFAVNDLRQTQDVYEVLGIETRLMTKERKDAASQQPGGLAKYFEDQYPDGKHAAVVYTGVATLAFSIAEDRENIRKGNKPLIPEQGLYYANIDEIDSITFDQALVEFILAEMGDELDPGEQDKYKFTERLASVLRNYGISEAYRLAAVESEEVKALRAELARAQTDYRAAESGRPGLAGLKAEIRRLESELKQKELAARPLDEIRALQTQLDARRAEYDAARSEVPALTALVDTIDRLRGEIDAKALAGMAAQGGRANPFYVANYDSKGLGLTHRGKELLEQMYENYSETLREMGVLNYEDFEDLTLKSLRSHALYLENVDYVVDPVTSEIKLVDRYTGEITDRRDEDVGVMLDTKHRLDGVRILGDNQTSSKVSGRDVIRNFQVMSGFSGSVFGKQAMSEFEQAYGKGPEKVKKIATAVKGILDLQDDTLGRKILLNRDEMVDWLGEEITAAREERGRSGTLVFVRSIRAAEEIRRRLIERGVISEEDIMILGDAKDVDKALVFASQLGKVVISTPVAGRGTDWKLPDWNDAKAILEGIPLPDGAPQEFKAAALGQALNQLKKDREAATRAEKIRALDAWFSGLFSLYGINEADIRARLKELEQRVIAAEAALRKVRAEKSDLTAAEAEHAAAREALREFKETREHKLLEAKDMVYARFVYGFTDFYQVNQSERIDKQVYGRVARQYDPGTARGFFVMEDGDKGDIAEIIRPGLMKSSERLRAAERKLLEDGRYAEFERTADTYRAVRRRHAAEVERLRAEGLSGAEIQARPDLRELAARIAALEKQINAFIREAQNELDRIDKQTRLIANGFNTAEWQATKARDQWYRDLTKGILEGKYDLVRIFSLVVEKAFEQYEETGDRVTLVRTLSRLGFEGLEISEGKIPAAEIRALKKEILARVSQIQLDGEGFGQFVSKVIKQMEMEFQERQKDLRSLYQSGYQSEEAKKKRVFYKLLFGLRDGSKKIEKWIDDLTGRMTAIPEFLRSPSTWLGTLASLWMFFGLGLSAWAVLALGIPLALLLKIKPSAAAEWIDGLIDRWRGNGFSFRIPFTRRVIGFGGFLGRTAGEIAARVGQFEGALAAEQKRFTGDPVENVADAMFRAFGGDTLHTEAKTESELESMAAEMVGKMTGKLGVPGVETEEASEFDRLAKIASDFISRRGLASALNWVFSKIGLGETLSGIVNFIRGEERDRVEKVYREVGRAWETAPPLAAAVAKVETPEARTVTQQTIQAQPKDREEKPIFASPVTIARKITGEAEAKEMPKPATPLVLGFEEAGTPADGRQGIVIKGVQGGIVFETRVALPEAQTASLPADDASSLAFFNQVAAAALGEAQEVVLKRGKDGETEEIRMTLPAEAARALITHPELFAGLFESRFNAVKIGGREYLFGRTDSGRVVYMGGEQDGDSEIRAAFGVLASPYYGNPPRVSELHEELEKRLAGVTSSARREKILDAFETEYPGFAAFLNNPYQRKIDLHGAAVTDSGGLVIGDVRDLAVNPAVTIERGAVVISSYIREGTVRRGAVLEGVSAVSADIGRGAVLRGVQSRGAIRAGDRSILRNVKDLERPDIEVGADQYLAGRFSRGRYLVTAGAAQDLKFMAIPQGWVRIFGGFLRWLYAPSGDANPFWAWIGSFITDWADDAGWRGKVYYFVKKPKKETVLQPFVNYLVGYSPEREADEERMFNENLALEGARRIWLAELLPRRLERRYAASGPFLSRIEGPASPDGRIDLSASDLEFLVRQGVIQALPDDLEPVLAYVSPEEADAFLSDIEAAGRSADPSQSYSFVLGLGAAGYFGITLRGGEIAAFAARARSVLGRPGRETRGRPAVAVPAEEDPYVGAAQRTNQAIEALKTEKARLEGEIARLNAETAATPDEAKQETVRGLTDSLEQVKRRIGLYDYVGTESGQTSFAADLNATRLRYEAAAARLTDSEMEALLRVRRASKEERDAVLAAAPAAVREFIDLEKKAENLIAAWDQFIQSGGEAISAQLEGAYERLKLALSYRKTEEFGFELKHSSDQSGFFAANVLGETARDGNPRAGRAQIASRLKPGRTIDFTGVRSVDQLDPRLRAVFDLVGLEAPPIVVVEVDDATHNLIASNVGQPPSTALNINLPNGVHVLVLKKGYLTDQRSALLPETLYEKIFQIIHEAVHSTQVVEKNYNVDNKVLTEFEAYFVQMISGSRTPAEILGNARWVNKLKRFFMNDISKYYLSFAHFTEARRELASKTAAGNAGIQDQILVMRKGAEVDAMLRARKPAGWDGRSAQELSDLELETLLSRMRQEDEALIDQGFETLIYLSRNLSLAEVFALIKKAKSLAEFVSWQDRAPQELRRLAGTEGAAARPETRDELEAALKAGAVPYEAAGPAKAEAEPVAAAALGEYAPAYSDIEWMTPEDLSDPARMDEARRAIQEINAGVDRDGKPLNAYTVFERLKQPAVITDQDGRQEERNRVYSGEMNPETGRVVPLKTFSVWTDEIVRGLEDGRYQLIVLRDEDAPARITGYAVISSAGDQAWVYAVARGADARKGAGTAMMLETMRWAKAQGYGGVSLLATPEADPFYVKLGDRLRDKSRGRISYAVGPKADYDHGKTQGNIEQRKFSFDLSRVSRSELDALIESLAPAPEAEPQTANSLGQSPLREVKGAMVWHKHHGLMLDELKQRFQATGRPAEVVVNFDPHQDLRGLLQEWMAEGNEATWATDALRQGLTRYYVQVTPDFQDLRGRGIHVWTLRGQDLFGRPKVVELKGAELQAALAELRGAEAVVSVDADAFSLQEYNPLLRTFVRAYHTPADGESFTAQSRPLIDFLTQNGLIPAPLTYFARSDGDDFLLHTWVNAEADEVYLTAVSDFMAGKMEEVRRAPRVRPGTAPVQTPPAALSLGVEEDQPIRISAAEAETLVPAKLRQVLDLAASEQFETPEGQRLAVKLVGGAARAVALKYLRGLNVSYTDVDGILYDPADPSREIPESILARFGRAAAKITERSYQDLAELYPAFVSNALEFSWNRLILEKAGEGYLLRGPKGVFDDIREGRLRFVIPPNFESEPTETDLEINFGRFLSKAVFFDLILDGQLTLDPEARDLFRQYFEFWRTIPDAGVKRRIAAQVLDRVARGVGDLSFSLPLMKSLDALDFFDGTPQKRYLQSEGLWASSLGVYFPPDFERPSKKRLGGFVRMPDKTGVARDYYKIESDLIEIDREGFALTGLGFKVVEIQRPAEKREEEEGGLRLALPRYMLQVHGLNPATNRPEWINLEQIAVEENQPILFRRGLKPPVIGTDDVDLESSKRPKKDDFRILISWVENGFKQRTLYLPRNFYVGAISRAYRKDANHELGERDEPRSGFDVLTQTQFDDYDEPGHAEITLLRENVIQVADLGSKNGTEIYSIREAAPSRLGPDMSVLDSIELRSEIGEGSVFIPMPDEDAPSRPLEELEAGQQEIVLLPGQRYSFEAGKPFVVYAVAQGRPAGINIFEVENSELYGRRPGTERVPIAGGAFWGEELPVAGQSFIPDDNMSRVSAYQVIYKKDKGVVVVRNFSAGQVILRPLGPQDVPGQSLGAETGAGFGRFAVPEIEVNKTVYRDPFSGEVKEEATGLKRSFEITTSTGRRILVSDHHHKALPFWIDAFQKGLLKKGSTLFHIDGHPDDVVSRRAYRAPVDLDNIPADYPEIINRYYDIDSFIAPAVTMGLIDPAKWFYQAELENEVFKQDLVWTRGSDSSGTPFRFAYGPERAEIQGVLDRESLDIVDVDVDVFAPQYRRLVEGYLARQMPEAEAREAARKELLEKWVPLLIPILARGKVVTIVTSPDYIEQGLAADITKVLMDGLNRFDAEKPAFKPIPQTVEFGPEIEKAKAEDALAQLRPEVWEAVAPVSFEDAEALAGRFYPDDSLPAFAPEFQPLIDLAQRRAPRSFVYWKLEQAYKTQGSAEAMRALAGLYKKEETLPAFERLGLYRFLASLKPDFGSGSLDPILAPASSLGRESRADFEQWILGALARGQGVGLNAKTLSETEVRQAIDWFFELDEEARTEALDHLEEFLTAELGRYAESLRAAGGALDFENLARKILFEGLETGRADLVSLLARINPGLSTEAIQTFLADIEARLGTAAINAVSRENTEGVAKALEKVRLSPEEFERAFNRLAAEKGLEISWLRSAEARPETGLAVAIHVDSLPDDLNETVFHALIQRLGDQGRLFLVFSRQSEAQEKEVARLIGFLGRNELRKVARLPYVGELPASEIDRQLGRVQEARKVMVMSLAYLKEVSQKLAAMKTGRETALYEYDGNAPSILAEPVLSLIVSDVEAEALMKALPDIVRKQDLGNGFFFLSIDLEAFVNLLATSAEAQRALEKAA
jgi:preprotein translocase subunit SecA